MTTKELAVRYVGNASQLNKTVSGVEQTHKHLGATVAKVGGILAGAFSIGAVVAFGKSSLQAYDGLLKAQERLSLGMGRIGQGQATKGIESWTQKFSMQTGIAQTDITDMASKLVTMGHGFFEALGPKSSSAIQTITSGILNLSAATGKSASMLMRSLGPQLVNTPIKAGATLAKYGVINASVADQIKALGTTSATSVKAMVKSGQITGDNAKKIIQMSDAQRSAAASQLELTALQTTYSGEAAKTATGLEKLKNMFNQVELASGKYVNKGLDALMKAMPKVIKWFQQLWLKLQPVVHIFAVTLANAAMKIWTILEKNLGPSLKKLWTAIAPVVKILGLLIAVSAILTIKALPYVVKAIALVVAVLAELLTIINKVVTFAITKIAPAFARAFGAVVNAVKTALNFLIMLWDNTIGKIAHGQTIGIGPLHTTLPNLYVTPMASGGIVRSPTLALIGERGPEAVVPLSRGGGGTTYIVNVHAEGNVWTTRDLAQEIRRELIRAARNNSSKVGLA